LIEKEILCSSLNFNLPLLKEEVDVEINVGVDVVGQIHWSLNDVDLVVEEVVVSTKLLQPHVQLQLNGEVIAARLQEQVQEQALLLLLLLFIL
jgi:hypothetical protein